MRTSLEESAAVFCPSVRASDRSETRLTDSKKVGGFYPAETVS